MVSRAEQMLEERRPARADARRNFDALLRAAAQEFAERGVDASLEDIAKRAGVGIGTLYRNFPTRDALIELAYLGELVEVTALAQRLGDEPAALAFATWLERVTDYLATKKVLLEGLTRDSPLLASCRGVLFDAGEPLLARAQGAGAVRSDVGIDDVIRLLMGVAGVAYPDASQRDRVIRIALDGLRPDPAPAAV